MKFAEPNGVIKFYRRISLFLLQLFRGMKKWYQDVIQEGTHQSLLYPCLRVFALNHFAVPTSVSDCFQRKSKFQLPYLLDRYMKAQSDKNGFSHTAGQLQNQEQG